MNEAIPDTDLPMSSHVSDAVVLPHDSTNTSTIPIAKRQPKKRALDPVLADLGQDGSPIVDNSISTSRSRRVVRKVISYRDMDNNNYSKSTYNESELIESIIGMETEEELINSAIAESNRIKYNEGKKNRYRPTRTIINVESLTPTASVNNGRDHTRRRPTSSKKRPTRSVSRALSRKNYRELSDDEGLEAPDDEAVAADEEEDIEAKNKEKRDEEESIEDDEDVGDVVRVEESSDDDKPIIRDKAKSRSRYKLQSTTSSNSVDTSNVAQVPHENVPDEFWGEGGWIGKSHMESILARRWVQGSIEPFELKISAKRRIKMEEEWREWEEKKKKEEEEKKKEETTAVTSASESANSTSPPSPAVPANSITNETDLTDVHTESIPAPPPPPPAPLSLDAQFWYLIKYRNRSHLHSRWVSEQHLLQFEDGEVRINNWLIKRKEIEIEDDGFLMLQNVEEEPKDHQELQTKEDNKITSKVVQFSKDESNTSDKEPLSVTPEISSKSEQSVDRHLSSKEEQIKSAAEAGVKMWKQGDLTMNVENSDVLMIANPEEIVNTDFPIKNTDVVKPKTEHDGGTIDGAVETEEEKARRREVIESAALVAFKSKEEQRKQQRIALIHAERLAERKARRNRSTFDPDLMLIDRIIDHRIKRKNIGKVRRSKKYEVLEEVESYQVKCQEWVIKRMQEMRNERDKKVNESSPISDLNSSKEEISDTNPVPSETSTTSSSLSSMKHPYSPPTASSTDDQIQYEFLVKWSKLGYDECTWESFETLREAHLRVAAILRPGAIRSISTLSLEAYLQPIKTYLTYISNTTTNPATTYTVVSASEEKALARKKAKEEREKLQNQKKLDKKRKVADLVKKGEEEKKKRKEDESNLDIKKRSTRVRGEPNDSLDLSSSDIDMSNSADEKEADEDIDETRTTTHSLSSLQSQPVTTTMSFGPSQLKLRPYQVDGVNWIVLNWLIKRNSILCDEMGLGKSCQAVCAVDYMLTRLTPACTGPVLIVAPLSTLDFWRREVTRFSNLYPVVYTGTRMARSIIRKHEWKWSTERGITYEEVSGEADSNTINTAGSSKRINHIRRDYKFNVLITSYTYIINDNPKLYKIPWEILVIDESQRIKSSESMTYKLLSTLNTKHKLLLTGTPIQNNMTELYALLHFVEPNIFHSLDKFLAETTSLTTSTDWSNFANTLRPYLLRRWKRDVEKNLPSKEEVIISVEMTLNQKKWYRAMYERNLKALVSTSKQSMLNVHMQLRKVCCHPWLIEGVENDETSDLRNNDVDGIMDRLVSGSGKFILIDKLLPKLKLEGHRVLLFSQMTRLLTILEDYLIYRGYKYCRLDGNVKGSEREEQIRRYNAPNSDYFAFLLSTRAGGLGITLTSADTVIIFDSDWNLQNDIQAMDRAHRIGQTKNVIVYRLLTSRTYEYEMFHKACLKLTLDKLVMTSIGSGMVADLLEEKNNNNNSKKGKDGNIPFDKRELEELLKKGAYDVFKDEEESAQKSLQFCDEDINKILDRSTVIRYREEEGIIDNKMSTNHHSTNKGGSAFSKATFVPEGGGGESLDLTDPDFWSKLGLVEKGLESDIMLPQGQKRERKPVFRAPLYEELFGGGVNGITSNTNGVPNLINKKSRSNSKKQLTSEEVGVCAGCSRLTEIDDPVPILICDTCDNEYHFGCINPPLLALPPEDQPWFCPACTKRKRAW